LTPSSTSEHCSKNSQKTILFHILYLNPIQQTYQPLIDIQFNVPNASMAYRCRTSSKHHPTSRSTSIQEKANQRSLPILNPLGGRSSASTRKLLAAPFTRMSSLPNSFTVISTVQLGSSFLRTSPSTTVACSHQHHRRPRHTLLRDLHHHSDSNSTIPQQSHEFKKLS
jgi:hypothetical protein